MKTTATGSFTNPAKKHFADIFGDQGKVPVTTLLPCLQILHDEFEAPQPAFTLDLDRCNTEQRLKIAHLLAERFNIPPEKMLAEMDYHGVPILAEDFCVPIDMRLLL